MYSNRSQAGCELADQLARYRGQDALVLALPRGGVEVGYEVAEALDAELDVLIVRKLGAPQNPEFGLGAIASHGARFVDDAVARSLGISQATIEQIEQVWYFIQLTLPADNSLHRLLIHRPVIMSN